LEDQTMGESLEGFWRRKDVREKERYDNVVLEA
jgi:hypothetical protein